jgi:hypothetical protein
METAALMVSVLALLIAVASGVSWEIRDAKRAQRVAEYREAAQRRAEASPKA